jgi:hypothetical protein
LALNAGLWGKASDQSIDDCFHIISPVKKEFHAL